MFLPTTAVELEALGWDRPDVILITGDAYIDSPHMGVAVIGKYLLKHGFKTAVIAQPTLGSGDDIKRLGEPRLFWGVTAGAIDSMVANYTATRKFRHEDDYSPGGRNVRPNRATIAYTNLIRQYFKNTKPIVLGGIEASLRRIAHYDYWDNSIRRSILFDTKADIIAYGMAEKTVVALARSIDTGRDWRLIPGICYISSTPNGDYTVLPAYEEVVSRKESFREMSKVFYAKADLTAKGFVQQHGDRFLVHTPPQTLITAEELDEILNLDFERDVHPYYKTGEIRALETIKQSITTHRGCFGSCNFCSIAVHQGRRIVSRSIGSILAEVSRIAKKPGFNGIIYDVGGPTANMYGTQCRKGWTCKDKRCLMPKPCPNLEYGHGTQMALLQKIRNASGIKKVFVTSGIRPDLVMADFKNGKSYIDQLVKYHVSGQIKLAPEHSEPDILSLMNKPPIKAMMQFKAAFDKICNLLDKRYYMTYYLIAGHPGCTMDHMRRLKKFLSITLRAAPEQVQIFTPTPSILSTAMYYCETDMTGKRIFCEKSPAGMQRQRNILKKFEGKRS
ncbi:MAG: hypothetical protein CSYNP_00974 [Syntrophus sp. SKADARSKE-3]|nr:hypothetical protein [Syntrophus sp. SKADARSKE-3]